MEFEMKHGQTLVITGPEGSGKTTLARKIAAQHGAFTEVGAHVFEELSTISRVLACAPATLIVEGFPTGEEATARIKALVTQATVACHRKGQNPAEMASPNLIFCCTEIPLRLDRFFVIRLPGVLRPGR